MGYGTPLSAKNPLIDFCTLPQNLENKDCKNFRWD
jgi:hypothetical protein